MSTEKNADSNLNGNPSADTQAELPWMPVAFVFLLIGGISLLLLPWGESSSDNLPGDATPSANGRVRIAIMPFVTETPGFEALGDGKVAEELVAATSEQFDVIGPQKTASYVAPGQLRQLRDDVLPDLIINGKFIEKDGAPKLLAEVLRAADGSPIWQQHYEPSTPSEQIVKQIAEQLTQFRSP